MTADPASDIRGRWPVALRGITESIVATRGPDGEWNLAALGLRADDVAGSAGSGTAGGTWPETTADREPTGHGRRAVTARTWGRTRTRRNLERTGVCVVQFTRDPVAFVEAALGVVTAADPVLESADAWVAVAADRTTTDVAGDAGEGRAAGDTRVDEWRLAPLAATVRRRVVPTTSRAPAAVVEATVAASRLDVPGYDAERLRRRLRYFAGVARSCGGAPERRAIERLAGLADVDLDTDGAHPATGRSEWPLSRSEHCGGSRETGTDDR